jgi:competence protein ComEA
MPLLPGVRLRRGRRAAADAFEAADRLRGVLPAKATSVDPWSPDVPAAAPGPPPESPLRTHDPVHADPRPRPRPRLMLDLPAALGILLVALAGVLLGGFYLWRSQPTPVTPPRAQVVARAASSATPTPSPSTVVVDVAGKVRRPGVVTLPLGSRVVDALKAAGGVRGNADTSTLNLARVLMDGEQVLVGVPAAPGMLPPGGVVVPGTPGSTVPLDLNTATLEQLDGLPGIGPVLAQRILDHRAEVGRFTSVEQLKDVSGIGEATFADLVDLVRV